MSASEPDPARADSGQRVSWFTASKKKAAAAAEQAAAEQAAAEQAAGEQAAAERAAAEQAGAAVMPVTSEAAAAVPEVIPPQPELGGTNDAAAAAGVDSGGSPAGDSEASLSDGAAADAGPPAVAAEAAQPGVGRAPQEPGEQPSGRDREAAALGMADLVTVVPGIARYHRSKCILIRFLGEGDLETMTRAAAEEASFIACRACQPDKDTDT